MDSSSFVVILRRLVFEKSFNFDFLLFCVAEGNMEAVFHFAFELVDKNALTLDFVVVLVEMLFMFHVVVSHTVVEFRYAGVYGSKMSG